MRYLISNPNMPYDLDIIGNPDLFIHYLQNFVGNAYSGYNYNSIIDTLEIDTFENIDATILDIFGEAQVMPDVQTG